MSDRASIQFAIAEDENRVLCFWTARALRESGLSRPLL